MIFFRMFFGSLLQLAPFAALCIVLLRGICGTQSAVRHC